jgi:hypothetical protein
VTSLRDPSSKTQTFGRFTNMRGRTCFARRSVRTSAIFRQLISRRLLRLLKSLCRVLLVNSQCSMEGRKVYGNIRATVFSSFILGSVLQERGFTLVEEQSCSSKELQITLAASHSAGTSREKPRVHRSLKMDLKTRFARTDEIWPMSRGAVRLRSHGHLFRQACASSSLRQLQSRA